MVPLGSRRPLNETAELQASGPDLICGSGIGNW